MLPCQDGSNKLFVLGVILHGTVVDHHYLILFLHTENMRDNSYWLLLRKIVGHELLTGAWLRIELLNLFNLLQVWTQKCTVQKASVDTEMCCPKGKCGCQYFILLTLSKKKSWTQGPGFFFNKKLILDYYFCLKSGPVFLFQIFIIAPLPLPRDIKLYH
jgi:hypothetical protein